MKKYTLDTNIISYLLKGNINLRNKIKKELESGNLFVINLISYYEVYRGLLAINNMEKLNSFKRLCQIFGIGQLTENTLYRAAEIYASLKIKGNLIEDADIIIRAICLEDNLILITNNQKHFQLIEGLRFDIWDIT